MDIIFRHITSGGLLGLGLGYIFQERRYVLKKRRDELAAIEEKHEAYSTCIRDIYKWHTKVCMCCCPHFP